MDPDASFKPLVVHVVGIAPEGIELDAFDA